MEFNIEASEDVYVQAAHLDAMAEQSMGAARLVENNPRTLDVQSIRSILDHAMNGA